MAKPTDRDRAFLTEVANGRVFHVHPFHFATSTDLLTYHGVQRTFHKLESNGLIHVDAQSTEYMRPVILTDLGRKALQYNG